MADLVPEGDEDADNLTKWVKKGLKEEPKDPEEADDNDAIEQGNVAASTAADAKDKSAAQG